MDIPNEQTWVEINATTLRDNYRAFAVGGTPIAPVIKSNAYGHDLVGVGRVLAAEDAAPFLVVATYRAAQELRAAGVEKAILVIGPVAAKVAASGECPDVSITVVDCDHARSLAAHLKHPQKVHIKIDTGMHRYGVAPADISELFGILSENSHITVVGMFSHLCDDFAELNDFTRNQILAFTQSKAIVERYAPHCNFFHLGSTASHDFRAEIPANLERVGFGLYGIGSFSEDVETSPVLTLVSKIASLREIAPGDTVGYGRTYTATQKRKIATIPAGYFEGVDRRLSNRGVVQVRDEYASIVGAVSMNATTIDVSEIDGVAVGDRVEIISADSAAENSANKIAQRIGAPKYQPTTQLPAQLERIFIRS